jgi:tight adherence protein C
MPLVHILTVHLVTVTFAATLTFGLAVFADNFSRRRRRHIEGRIGLVAPTEVSAARPDVALVRRPASRLDRREEREVVRLLGRLKIAPSLAVPALTLARFGCAIVFAGLGGVIAVRAFHAGGSVWITLALAAVAGCAGWALPVLLAHAAAERRAAAVARGLPDALELLVVCVEAGLALENAILRVTEELKAPQPLLAEELAMTAADLKVLSNLDEGLANLATRVDLPEVHSVVTILSQSIRYGTPLADALRSAAAGMRDEALIRLEERGNRLPTLLTLPMMLFILPTIFLIVGGPAALRTMDVFSH